MSHSSATSRWKKKLRCVYVGCMKYARYAKTKNDIPLFCKLHTIPDFIHISKDVSQISKDICTKITVYSKTNKIRYEYCSAHAKDPDKNCKFPKCQHAKCMKIATEFCKKHTKQPSTSSSPFMLCQHGNCQNPTFVDCNGITSYCIRHAISTYCPNNL
jgi:hypothetical protein